MTPAEPEVWYTIDHAARVCERHPRTIRNLISQHQLPVRRLWKVFRRLRRRVTFVSPATLAYLQQITLMGQDPDQIMKPRR